MRTVCYHLLDLIPDEGLEEVLNTLSDCWEFYSSRHGTLPALPEVHEIKGTVSEVMERPPLYIDEA
jgi:hypothetical protein